MDPELHKLTTNLKNRGRDGSKPFSKETGPKFAMPKHPIERQEMENHMRELIDSRAVSTENLLAKPAACQEDLNYPVTQAATNPPAPNLRLPSIENDVCNHQTHAEIDSATSAPRANDQVLVSDASQKNGSRSVQSPMCTAYASGEANSIPVDQTTVQLQNMALELGALPHDVTGNLLNFSALRLTEDDRAQFLFQSTAEEPESAEILFKAMNMRRKYMTKSLQTFHRTTARYLDAAQVGLSQLITSEEEYIYFTNSPAVVSISDHPIDPPGVTGDPFEVRDWPEAFSAQLEFRDGVMHVLPASSADGHSLPRFDVPSLAAFLDDYNAMCIFLSDGPLKSFCYRRLSYLASKFALHTLLNEQLESFEQKRVPHRDFYNIRKVDTHLHAASCMNQKHLLRFIKKTIRTEADRHVYQDKGTGQLVTMKELVDRIGITPYDLNIDNFDMHADRNTFHRFDKFNKKYNPIGQSELREVFLKTDNYVRGVFFANVLKEVFSDIQESKYQNAEPRLSIYGQSIDEWDNLSKWAIDNKVYSDNIRWLIQIPRLFDVFHAKGKVVCFQELLTNVFQPLFEVSIDPKSHPEMHAFLQYVVGFDSVDDESKSDFVVFDKNIPPPQDYCRRENPPYSYYIFYLYANICQLNQLRSSRGLNTFTLRPHSGEAGHLDHLVASFLLAEGINHGLLLRKAPVLQYLFYLTQIGIAMSPLSNNSLFLDYHRNPLNVYLSRGLNVCLSSDDPLQFHFTKEPLIEEYSIATQVWKLSSADMSELARNSVLQSGFSPTIKSHWLGPNYMKEGVLGNDITRSNVPNIRIAYRYQMLTGELRMLLTSKLLSRSPGYRSRPISPQGPQPADGVVPPSENGTQSIGLVSSSSSSGKWRTGSNST